MEITVFSFMVTFLWVNLFVIVLSFVRRHTKVFHYVSFSFLNLIIILTLLRLFLPFESSKTIVIKSSVVLSKIQLFLISPIVNVYFGSTVIEITISSLLISIWFIAGAVLLFKSYFQYKSIYRIFNLLPKQRDKQIDTALLLCKDMLNIDRNKDIKVVTQKMVGSPMIIGFIKPIIILPDIKMDEIELKSVFLHELIHYHYKHVILKIIAEIIQIIFWWNPILMLFKREVSNILEMFTDKKLGELLTNAEQKKYLQFIIKMVKDSNRNRQLSPLAFGLIKEDTNSFMYQRFEMLLENNYRKSKFKNDIALLMIVALVFISSYSFVIQPHSQPTIYDYLDGFNLENGNTVVGDNGHYEIYDKSGNKVATIVITETGANLKTIKNEGESKL